MRLSLTEPPHVVDDRNDVNGYQSRPAELLQTDRIVPDVGHVFDLSAIKFHVVELQMSQPLPVS